MMNQVLAMVLAVGIAAGVAFREAVVRLFYDPPVVECEGAWVTGCEMILQF